MPGSFFRLMTTPALRAIAVAQPNIALVKYWGKRDAALNLPAAGSLSITLDVLHTRTRLDFDEALDADDITLNGERDEVQSRKIGAFLDLFRARGHHHARACRNRQRLPDRRRACVLGIGLCSAGGRGRPCAGSASRRARTFGAGATRLGIGRAFDLRRIRGNGSGYAR
jgi:hypothetical protein